MNLKKDHIQEYIAMPQMMMDDIKSKWDNKRTFSNIKCQVKRVNKILQLEPLEGIHIEQWEQRFQDIAVGLIDTIELPTIHKVKNIMTTLGKVIRNSGGSDWFTNECATLINLDIRAFAKQWTAKPWSEMMEMCDSIIKNSRSIPARIICTCYKYGYVLRLSEIIMTLLQDDGENNFLDIINGVWIIRKHKTVRRNGYREFPVSDEFLNELSKYISGEFRTLIGKTRDTLYSEGCQYHQYFGINGFSNRDIRNSWEEYANTLPDQELRKIHSMNVLGHSDKTVRIHYQNPHNVRMINGKIKVHIRLKNKIDTNLSKCQT